jgi:hypothetical protein
MSLQRLSVLSVGLAIALMPGSYTSRAEAQDFSGLEAQIRADLERASHYHAPATGQSATRRSPLRNPGPRFSPPRSSVGTTNHNSRPALQGTHNVPPRAQPVIRARDSMKPADASANAVPETPATPGPAVSNTRQPRCDAPSCILGSAPPTPQYFLTPSANTNLQPQPGSSQNDANVLMLSRESQEFIEKMVEGFGEGPPGPPEIAGFIADALKQYIESSDREAERTRQRERCRERIALYLKGGPMYPEECVGTPLPK